MAELAAADAEAAAAAVVADAEAAEAAKVAAAIAEVARLERNKFDTASGPCCNTGCPKEAIRRCTGCRRVGYCDERCQRASWAGHKVQCRAWAAEPGAAGVVVLFGAPGTVEAVALEAGDLGDGSGDLGGFGSLGIGHDSGRGGLGVGRRELRHPPIAVIFVPTPRGGRARQAAVGGGVAGAAAVLGRVGTAGRLAGRADGRDEALGGLGGRHCARELRKSEYASR